MEEPKKLYIEQDKLIIPMTLWGTAEEFGIKPLYFCDPEGNDYRGILYQQVLDWLREQHQIHVTILPDKNAGRIVFNTKIDIDTDYSYSLIQPTPRTEADRITTSDTYNKALNKGIAKAFQIIKEEK